MFFIFRNNCCRRNCCCCRRNVVCCCKPHYYLCCDPCANYNFLINTTSTTVTPVSSFITTNNLQVAQLGATQLFTLGNLVSRSGNAISYNQSTNQFTINKSGTYKITYSFTANSNNTGEFATQIQYNPDNTRIFDITANQPLNVSVSETLNANSGEVFGLIFSPVSGSSVTNLTISNLIVKIEKV